MAPTRNLSTAAARVEYLWERLRNLPTHATSETTRIIEDLASLALQSSEARFLSLVAADESFGEAGFVEARCYQLRPAGQRDVQTRDRKLFSRLGVLRIKLDQCRYRESIHSSRCRGLTKTKRQFGPACCSVRPQSGSGYCHHHANQQHWCYYSIERAGSKYALDDVCQTPREYPEGGVDSALPFCILHNAMFDTELKSIEQEIDTLDRSRESLREKLEQFHAENPLTVTAEVPPDAQDEDCVICQEALHKRSDDAMEIDGDDTIQKQRRCRHLFHGSCLAQWHKARDEYGIFRSGSCPSCRQPVWDESGICGVEPLIISPETERIAHGRLAFERITGHLVRMVRQWSDGTLDEYLMGEIPRV